MTFQRITGYVCYGVAIVINNCDRGVKDEEKKIHPGFCLNPCVGRYPECLQFRIHEDHQFFRLEAFRFPRLLGHVE